MFNKINFVADEVSFTEKQ